jgi:hypothetical protein
MVKQPKSYFEALLGINAPWTAHDIIIDEVQKIIEIEVTTENEKSMFHF